MGRFAKYTALLAVSFLCLLESCKCQDQIGSGPFLKDPEVNLLSQFEKDLYDKIVNQSGIVRPIRPRSAERNETSVKVNLFIEDIKLKHVEKALYEIHLSLMFRQKWTDPRLTYDVSRYPDFKYLALGRVEIKGVWAPQLYFPNAYKADFQFVTAPNVFTWIYPNGTILYNLRLSLTAYCRPYNDEEFEVVCPLEVESVVHTSDELILGWADGEEGLPAVELKEDIYIPEFSLKEVNTTRDEHKVAHVGSFGRLLAEFRLTKNVQRIIVKL